MFGPFAANTVTATLAATPAAHSLLAVAGHGRLLGTAAVLAVLAAFAVARSAARSRARIQALETRLHDCEKQRYQQQRAQSERHEAARHPSDGNAPPTDGDLAPTAMPATAPPPDSRYPILLFSLQEIARRIGSSLDPNTVLQTIVNTTRTLLKTSGCRVFLFDAAAGALVDPLAAPDDPGALARLPADRGMAGWVVHNRQILTLDDIRRDHSLRDLPEQQPLQAYATAPLAVGREVLGVLSIADAAQPGPEFDRLLQILANFAALALKNAQLFRRIEEMARHDGLTLLLNRATFEREAQAALADASRNRLPFSVLLSDVDHFKQCNDTYGHQAGDAALRQIAALYRKLTPHGALLGRYGGEEFVFALPNTELDDAARFAETLRRAVETLVVRFEQLELDVTVSIGVACGANGDAPLLTQRTEGSRAQTTRVPSSGPGGDATLRLLFDEIVQAADQALYEAKHAGRNRVCCAPAAAPPPARP